MTNEVSLIKRALQILRIRADGGRGFEDHGYPLSIDEAAALLKRFHALERELQKYDPSFTRIGQSSDEPPAPQRDCATPVPQARLFALAREFVECLKKDPEDADVSMTWNEGVSILNELINSRAQNRTCE